MPDHDDYLCRDEDDGSSIDDGLTDDELAEQIERDHWALEIMSQVALMNARTLY